MHLPSPRILLSGHSFPSDTEERQTKQLWYPHTDSPVICESIVRLRSHMHDALHRWNDFSDINTYLLSLDGLSGSGKSTLSQNISTTVSHMPGVSFYPVRVDGFIATARHSPLRLRMLESREFFCTAPSSARTRFTSSMARSTMRMVSSAPCALRTSTSAIARRAGTEVRSRAP